MQPLRVTVWNENVHEHSDAAVARIYPEGIHGTIAAALRSHGERFGQPLEVKTATLQEPDHGLTDEVLASTDVLTWWGHAAHELVEDKIVDRVQQRVLQGMGLVVLHSGHLSKIFRRMMGTSCMLQWRDAGERERIWVTNPGHPIAAGINQTVELEHSEMYGEPFGIPSPDEQVFISWFEGGEVFRGGNCWTRGNGKIFYFSPGHETHPIYHHADIQRIIYNGVVWARPQGSWDLASYPSHVPAESAREKIAARTPNSDHLHATLKA